MREGISEEIGSARLQHGTNLWHHHTKNLVMRASLAAPILTIASRCFENFALEISVVSYCSMLAEFVAYR